MLLEPIRRCGLYGTRLSRTCVGTIRPNAADRCDDRVQHPPGGVHAVLRIVSRKHVCKVFLLASIDSAVATQTNDVASPCGHRQPSEARWIRTRRSDRFRLCSNRKIPCQVPSMRQESCTGMDTLVWVNMERRCAGMSSGPSAVCVYNGSCSGISRLSQFSIS